MKKTKGIEISIYIRNLSEEKIEEIASLLNPSYGWAIEEQKGKTKLKLFVSEEESMILKKYLSSTNLKYEIKTMTDWEENFRRSFKGVEVGRFFVRPPWIEKREEKVDIVIYPASGFGTGDHESTKGMLMAIDRLYEGNLGFHRALDVGTGSGILSIAAKKLGLVDEIYAIDISDLAIDNATTNIELNGIDGIFLILGTIDTLNPKAKFDLIMANIDSETLPKLKEDIVDLLDKNGFLLISGFTKMNFWIIDLYSTSLKLVDTIAIENWVTAIYYKN